MMMIVEIIGLIFIPIIAVIIGVMMNKKDMSFKMFPKPFLCSLISADEGFKLTYDNAKEEYHLSFDFSKSNCKDERTYVSLVYQFNEPVSLRRFKQLKCDVDFKAKDLEYAIVEFKHSDLRIFKQEKILNEKIASKSGLTKDTSTTTRTKIIIFDKQDKEELKDVKEICFAIKPSYFKSGKELKGEFILKNIEVK